MLCMGKKKEKQNPLRCPLLIKVIDGALKLDVQHPLPAPVERQSWGKKKRRGAIPFTCHSRFQIGVSDVRQLSLVENRQLCLFHLRGICAPARVAVICFSAALISEVPQKRFEISRWFAIICSGFILPSLCRHLRTQKVHAPYARAPWL